MAIPKLFHYFWHDGEEAMPECYRYFLKHAKELHPDWEFVFWDKTNMPEIRNRELFDKQPWWTYKSNILRYQLLEDHGGVWMDVDALPLRNFDPLLDREYLLFQSRQGYLCSWCFGSEKGHSLVRHLNDSIVERSKSFSDNDEGYFFAFDGPAISSALLHLDIPVRIMPPSSHIHYSHSHKCPKEDRMNVQMEKMLSRPEAFVMHFMNHKNSAEGIVLHESLPVYQKESLP